jgi:hypothetical protein
MYLSSAAVAARRLAKSILRPILYTVPPIRLQPERMYLWLGSLIETRGLSGAILEVGCDLGGTAAYSSRMLRNLDVHKRYVCVDTFSGFVRSQFDADVKLGNSRNNRWRFADNSMSLTRGILDQLGSPEVELVQGDIVTLDADALPAAFSAVLIDVDLAEPVYAALMKVYPRLTNGGVILVDDCPDEYDWQARQGYERFCKESGLTPEYRFGVGIVRNN